MIDLSLCQAPYEFATAVWVAIRQPIRYSELQREIGISTSTFNLTLYSLIAQNIIKQDHSGKYIENSTEKRYC